MALRECSGNFIKSHGKSIHYNYEFGKDNYKGGDIMNINVKKFSFAVSRMNEKELLWNSIICGIAPTLCTIKCASILSFTRYNKDILSLWNLYKHEFLESISIKCYELVNKDNISVVLFYNEDKLKETLYRRENISFLKNIGYKEDMCLEEYLDMLKKRYKLGCPHEMGLFLGIPLEDVIQFIDKKGREYLYSGYWKVYSNLESTLNIFNTYDDIRSLVINKIGEGASSIKIMQILNEYKEGASTQVIF